MGPLDANDSRHTGIEPEDELLSHSHQHGGASGPEHAVRTAPVFTRQALNIVGDDVLPQRALYGSVLAQRAPGFPENVDASDAKVYMNTNAPFSGVVCGVQGSGKSHTTSVLLEGCLIKDRRIGTLPVPLTGLVFHFDTAAGGGAVQPCEAAYLAALDPARAGGATPPDVTVLVIPNYVNRMRQVYAGLPNVRVAPLHFAPEDISGERLLAIMKVDSDTQMPLYMEVIMDILRSMDVFNYRSFRADLEERAKAFAPNQKAMLSLRMSLLDSCLKNGSMANRVSSHFKPGRLTIVDLSSPFMDAASACSFFDIILGLFIEHRPQMNGLATKPPPKLVVLDEAHKYLTENGASSRLTESLLSIVRQQRHENMRVIISTQEPTVVPSKFLDLCSFIIAHRFSSPRWLKHLAEHVSAASAVTDDWASRVVSLQTGEAMMFAPAGLAVKENSGDVAPIGQGYLVVRSRLRITQDGGQSLLAIQEEDAAADTSSASATSPSHSTAPSLSDTGSSAATSSSSTQGWGAASGGAASPVILSQSTISELMGLNVQATPSATPLPMSAPAISQHAPPPPVTVSTPVYVTAAAPTARSQMPVPLPAPPATSRTTASSVPTEYRGLVAFLRSRRDAGEQNVSLSDVGIDRGANPQNYRTFPSKLKTGLETAHSLGIVVLGGKGNNQWVKLSNVINPSSSALASTIPVEFAGLIHCLRHKQQAGVTRVMWTTIGDHRNQNKSMYTMAPKAIKDIIMQANASGLVTVGGDIGRPGGQWVQLKLGN